MGTRRLWTQHEIDRLKELSTGSLSTQQLGTLLGRHREVVRQQMVKHGLVRIGKTQPMEKNYFWKGGRKVEKRGYILVKCPGHPYLNSSGYIREHRLIMEIILGRYLLPTEVVGHKDHNPSNNDPDNLKLYPCNAEHLKEELTGHIPQWTPEGRARILRAVRLNHHRVDKPPRLPFDRSAWSKARQRNANGEFARQLPANNGQQ